MNSLKNQYPEALTRYCLRWSNALGGLPDMASRIDCMRRELPVFLKDRAVCRVLLEKIASGNPYPDARRAALFDSEIHLYTDPRRLFSLHIYLYGPGEYSIIHDHNSWGVIGVPFGDLEVRKFERIADTNRIRQTGDLRLGAGTVDVTLPLDEGIHATGNPTDQPLVMISLYGTPLRRLYINCYRPDTGERWKRYHPRVKKKMLAARALKYYC